MRAVVVANDQSLQWLEVPDAAPGAGEVLLRVHATAVNRADLLQRKGLYPPPAGAPPWMGLEAAGIVESVGPSAGPSVGPSVGPSAGPSADPSAGPRSGSSSGPSTGPVTGPSTESTEPPTEASKGPWQPGDRVCCLLAGGGYAERVAVDARQVLPIPANLSFEEGASLPEAFATAWLNLVREAGLREGETVLVHAGASGVGTAAIQIARCLGARVAATVGSEEKARFVHALGASVVIRHRDEDVTARLGSLATDGGLDVVLDCLGGEDLGNHLSLLNTGGRWVVIALMRGRETRVDLRALLSKRLRLIGSTLRARPPEEKGRILEDLRRRVWPWIESGEVKPVVHAVLPIEEAESAHAILERNENIGKVVLRIAGSERADRP